MNKEEFIKNNILNIIKFLEMKGLLQEDTLESLKEDWSSYSSTIDKTHPEDFYLSWINRMGASNIVCNFYDQFRRDSVVKNISHIYNCKKKYIKNILDYGCGTASLSFFLYEKLFPECNLFLSDVNNLSSEFVRWLLKEKKLENVNFIDTDLESIEDETIDLIYCIDVLEHLKNPSDIFKKLDKKLKRDGSFILLASWGDHSEHLKEAREDWITNKMYDFIKEKYYELNYEDYEFSSRGILLKK